MRSVWWAHVLGARPCRCHRVARWLSRGRRGASATRSREPPVDTLWESASRPRQKGRRQQHPPRLFSSAYSFALRPPKERAASPEAALGPAALHANHHPRHARNSPPCLTHTGRDAPWVYRSLALRAGSPNLAGKCRLSLQAAGRKRRDASGWCITARGAYDCRDALADIAGRELNYKRLNSVQPAHPSGLAPSSPSGSDRALHQHRIEPFSAVGNTAAPP